MKNNPLRYILYFVYINIYVLLLYILFIVLTVHSGFGTMEMLGRVRKRSTAIAQAVGRHFLKVGDVHAHYADISCVWFYHHNPRKMRQPPLGQVTVV